MTEYETIGTPLWYTDSTTGTQVHTYRNERSVWAPLTDISDLNGMTGTGYSHTAISAGECDAISLTDSIRQAVIDTLKELGVLNEDGVYEPARPSIQITDETFYRFISGDQEKEGTS